jgi:hypothetical protein
MRKSSMKDKLLRYLLILIGLTTLFIVAAAEPLHAQLSPYYFPFPNFFSYCPFSYCPFPYFPFLPPPPSYAPLTAYGRNAHVPLTSIASLFPAPVLPTVPAVTAGGVGLTTLIPLVPVAATVPASALVISPLAPLITYTPLSLVGLTYAPIPVTTLPAPVPLPVPTVLPTATTITSLISALLLI